MKNANQNRAAFRVVEYAGAYAVEFGSAGDTIEGTRGRGFYACECIAADLNARRARMTPDGRVVWFGESAVA